MDKTLLESFDILFNRAINNCLSEECSDFYDYQCNIEYALRDYSEIKEMEKYYHFDDLAHDTHKIETDRKWLVRFDAGICDIQEDYRKARAFDIIVKKEINIYQLNKCSSYAEYNKYILDEYRHDKEGLAIRALSEEEFDLVKRAML